MNAKRSPTRRLIRWLGFGLVNLVVLVVIVALAAPLFFDPNDYKSTIAEQVRARTGRELTIVGDLSFSVLPWLGVRTGEIRLGNAPGFGETPFARFSTAEVRVKLVPLFSREVQMDTIRVNGLELNLARDAAGKSNWDDLAAAQAAPAQGGTGGGASAAPALAAFALGGVNIEHAALTYADAATGERIALSDVAVRTGAVSLGEPVDAEVSLRFEHPRAGGKLDAKARLTYDLGAKRYGAAGLVLDTEVTARALGTGAAKVHATGDLNFDDTAKMLTARGLALSLDTPAPPGSGLTGPLALEASGDVDLRLAEKTVTSPALRLRIPALQHDTTSVTATVNTGLAGTLDTQRFALKGLRGEGTVSGPRFGATAMPVRLDGDVVLDLPAQSVDITALHLEAAEFKAGGEVHVKGFGATPAVSGTLAAPGFAVGKLLARFGVAPPATRDPKALASAAFSTGFSSNGRQLGLKPLKLELDGATLEGSASVSTTGALAFQLAVNRLDVDRYLPPAATAAPPSAAGALPVGALRGLDVDGRLKVGALRYAGLDLANVTVGVKARDSQLRLDPLQADLYGGRYDGDIRVDARGDLPVMELDEKVGNIDAAALFAALGVNTGLLDLRGGRSDLALKARVTSDAAGKRVQASGIVLDGKLAGRSFRGGAVPVGLRGNVAVDLAAKNAVLEKVQARFAELNTAADLRIGFAPGALSYAGSVDTPPFDLRALAGRLGVPVPRTSDGSTFTAVGGRANVDGTAAGLKASDLAVALDGSTLKGRAEIQNFASPALGFDIEVDRLDVDRYLPPSAQGKAATPGAAATALPVDLVRSLNLNGTLKVGALKVSGVRMSNVRLTAVGKDGLLKMSPLAAALYGGRYDGNVTVDARAQATRVSLDETIQGVQVGDLLRDVTGKAPVLTGATDLRAVLSATGGDTEALKRTLDGDVRFAIRNGTLEKIDMVNSMCNTLAALDFDNLNKKTIAAGVIGLLLNSQHKSTPSAGGGSGTRTEFTDMSGSARLVKGVARNDDLAMSSPIVRVRGAGTVDLPGARLDYRAEAELVQSCAGIGQRDLAGQIIPVSISGPIADPSVKPEIPASLVQALRKRKASEQPAAAAPAPAPAPTQQQVLPGRVLPGQKQQQAQPAPQQPAQPPPPQQPTKPKDALRGILEGLLKKQ